MEKVRGDLHTLYQREQPRPPGLPLATHVESAKVNDTISSEAEVEDALRRLCPHMAGVPRGKIEDPPPRMERWLCLVDIVHNMWHTGDIPQDLGLNILLLIPKGTINTRVIGLL